MIGKVVVIGANGRVGRLFSELLTRDRLLHAAVDLSVSAPCSVPFFCGDILSPGTEIDRALNEADCVLMCIPPEAAQAAIPIVRERMRGSGLWVDTCSVKTTICRELQQLDNHQEILSINPMAAPELGIRNQRVAVVVVRSGPLAHSFMDWLRAQGAVSFELSAQDHDRISAAVQVATHAALLVFGLTLGRIHYSTDEALPLWTPPHELLMMLLGRMVSVSPDVYMEIQNHHPQGEQVRAELLRAIQDFSRVLGENDAVGFENLITEIRTAVGPGRHDLARRCAALLASLKPAPE